VLIETAIRKDVKADVRARLIIRVRQVVNLPVVLRTVILDALFLDSNIGFPIGLTITPLNSAIPTKLAIEVVGVRTGEEFGFVDKQAL
jgi:hypothetical protein